MIFSTTPAFFVDAATDETFVSNLLFLWGIVLITGVVLSVGVGLILLLNYRAHRPYFLEGHTLEGA